MPLIVNSYRIQTLIPAYLVWFIAECLQVYPVLSYFIAWLGSFFIFYITLFSTLKFHSLDRPLIHQIMRPIFLVQLIFAGFMCCTSICYFMDHLGYTHLLPDNQRYFQATGQTVLIAKCQRIALLAHVALVTGIIVLIKPLPTIKYHLCKLNNSFLIQFCILNYIAAFLIQYIPGLIQFKYSFLSLSISSGTYILIKGIHHRDYLHLVFGIFSFGLNLLNATLTGYKESIIVNVILFSFLAFPYYKKTIFLFCLPSIYVLLYILPTFTMIIRVQSWMKGKPKEEARNIAYQTFFETGNEEEINNNTWTFLTHRFSEIDMFTKYVDHYDQVQECNFNIIINSCYALIPRIFWHGKPDTEKLAMERVYRSGIAQRTSNVSAKTRPVVDGYLTGGMLSVFLYIFCYGLVVQLISNTAERLFGGYNMGCIIIFNSLFQQFWRGNTLEFLLNNIIYAYLLMMIIHTIMKHFGCLKLLDFKGHHQQTYHS